MILLREAVNPLYVEEFKARLEGVLRACPVEGVPAHGRENQKLVNPEPSPPIL